MTCCTAYSRNGLYLASCCGNNGSKTSVTVWDMSSRASFTEQLVGREVTSLGWSPSSNALVLTLQGGALLVWEDVVPADMKGPNDLTGLADDMELLQMMIAGQSGCIYARPRCLLVFTCLSVDEEDGAVAPATESAQGQTAPMDLDDNELLRAVSEAEAGLNSQKATTPAATSSAAPTTPAAKKSRLTRNASSSAPELEVEDVAVEPDPFETPAAPAAASFLPGAATTSQAVVEAMEKMVERFNLKAGQPAFGPSASTAVASSSRRVLVWNRVGRVTCVDDRSESIVEVEFADMTMHRKIRVADLYAYNMGALSEAGVALAAASNDEAGTRAVVHFKPVTGLVGGAEWQELLETGDDVAGVALGHDWVAAVTLPFHFLYIWSVCGLQQLPIQLPISKFVSIVGQGTRLAIFHHTPVGLHVLVYDMALHRQVFNCPAPMTAGSTLTWCGFTPTGVLVSLDSAGIGRVLINAGSWTGQWVPLTHAEGKVDVSRRWPLGWPIGATDDSLIVVRLTETEEEETGLVLDDDNRGAPVIDTVRWNAPLLNPNSAMATGLELVLRRRLMLSQSAEPNPRRELEIDSEVVKLIALAAKNGHAHRGMDLFRTIKSSKFRMAAMKWCGANGYDALFSRMEQEWRSQAQAAGIDLDAANQIPSGGKRGANNDDDLDQEERDRDSVKNSKKRSTDSLMQPMPDSGIKRKQSKSAGGDDDLFDDEGGSTPPPATQTDVKAAPPQKRSNPFKAKGAQLKRSGSSGGVFEALARIEAGGGGRL